MGNFAATAGKVGDALAMAGGRAPVYKPFQDERAAKNAFSQLLGDPANQNAFAELARVNPSLAMQFKNATTEQQLAQAKLAQNAITDFQRDAAAAGASPGTPEYQRLLEARYNQMRLYGTPEGGYTPDPNWRPIFGATVNQPVQEAPSPISVPTGSPLQGAPNAKVIGGKQYWQINGKWYDNPEGR